DGDGDGDGDGDVSCQSYCELYLSACADLSEYDNMDSCMANCWQWPEGDPGDIDVDSLQCRYYHATVAQDVDPIVHCPHAGPSGSGVCVAADAPTCQPYCDAFFMNCDMGNLNPYTDPQDCLDTCMTWYPGADGQVDGHTVGCHLYHTIAAGDDAMLHCPHAAPAGGGVCVLPNGP
ncbi:MAG: hypothetical protein KC468_02760, partial [Myxococcales bacterium]|nr:hypothetical protein [Myxococcales bacterium]